MSDLRRVVARGAFGSAIAAGTGVALAWGGLPDAYALGAAVGVGIVVGRALFGQSWVLSRGRSTDDGEE